MEQDLIERIVSSKGICNIYEFLAYKFPDQVNHSVHKQFQERPEDAAIIANAAIPGSLCEQAMTMFSSSYGAHCGSVALMFMPFGGLYITGNVSSHSSTFLQNDSNFMEAYFEKGRLSPMLEKVPLLLVHQNDLHERGIHMRALRLLKQHLVGRKSRLKPIETKMTDSVPPRECMPDF